MITPNDFIQAARTGNKEKVRAYIAENSDNPAAINIKYVDRYKSVFDQYREESALFHAVMGGQLEIVLILLEVPGIEINDAVIAAAERPSYNFYANILRNQIFRKMKITLSHEELCKVYSSKEEFSRDFTPEYDGSIDHLYEKYLQLDEIHNVTKRIFLAVLAKNPSQEALDQALLKGDEDFTDLLVGAGASLAFWEKMSTKPETPKDRYLHFLAIIPLIKRQIQYIEENLAQQDISILDDIVFSFATLLATQEKYEAAAHSLYEVAADMNNERAKNIVNSFSKPQKTTLPSLVSLCTQTLWKSRQVLQQENLSKNKETLENDSNTNSHVITR